MKTLILNCEVPPHIEQVATQCQVNLDLAELLRIEMISTVAWEHSIAMAEILYTGDGVQWGRLVDGEFVEDTSDDYPTTRLVVSDGSFYFRGFYGDYPFDFVESFGLPVPKNGELK